MTVIFDSIPIFRQGLVKRLKEVQRWANKITFGLFVLSSTASIGIYYPGNIPESSSKTLVYSFGIASDNEQMHLFKEVFRHLT